MLLFDSVPNLANLMGSMFTHLDIVANVVSVLHGSWAEDVHFSIVLGRLCWGWWYLGIVKRRLVFNRGKGKLMVTLTDRPTNRQDEYNLPFRRLGNRLQNCYIPLSLWQLDIKRCLGHLKRVTICAKCKRGKRGKLQFSLLKKF